jgi:hypothetical protein
MHVWGLAGDTNFGVFVASLLETRRVTNIHGLRFSLGPFLVLLNSRAAAF